MHAQSLSTLSNLDLNSAYPFTESGHCYLFDSNSLAVVKIPQDVVDLIADAKSHGWNDGVAEFTQRNGTMKSDSATTIVSQLCSKGLFRKENPLVQSSLAPDTPIGEAYLILTDACNLACRYCFVPTTLSHGSRRFMPPDIVKQSLKFLFANANSSGISIVLWGGEPLLSISQIRDMLSEASRLSIETGIPVRFATTSNCTTLTPDCALLLAKHRVIVNLSLDGGEKQHNQHRIFKDGHGTFAKIGRNLVAFLEITRELFPEYVPRARMTVTHSTVRSLCDSYRSIWDMGIPVVWAKDVDWLPEGSNEYLAEDDFAALTEQYSALRDLIFDKLASDAQRSVFPQIWWDLHRIHQRIGSRTACGAGCAGISIDPEGRTFVCYHLREQGQRFQLGTVFGFDSSISLREECARRNVDSVSGCQRCEFKYLCGGGCFAKGAARGQSIFDTWHKQCGFIRAYQEHCIRLYARLMSSKFQPQIVALLGSVESHVGSNLERGGA